MRKLFLLGILIFALILVFGCTEQGANNAASNENVSQNGLSENAFDQSQGAGLCGNGSIDVNENCANCAIDVKCKSTENCVNANCVAKPQEKTIELDKAIVLNHGDTAKIANRDEVIQFVGILSASSGEGPEFFPRIKLDSKTIDLSIASPAREGELLFTVNALDLNKTILTLTVSVQTAFCGNNAVDSGENCSNCPDDVKCSSGFECVDGNCEKIQTQTQTPDKTGNFVEVLKNGSKISLYSGEKVGVDGHFLQLSAVLFTGTEYKALFNLLDSGSEKISSNSFISGEIMKFFDSNGDEISIVDSLVLSDIRIVVS